MKTLFSITLLIILRSTYFAQTDTTQLMNDKLIQFIEQASEDIEDNQFYNIVEELISNPIDLNTANKNDLLKIPFISPNEVSIILNERNKRKGFASVNELNTINSIHPDLIILLRPFITVSKIDQENKKKEKTKQFELQFRSRIISDLQVRKGFMNGNFVGNRLKSYNRIKANIGDFRFGLLSEKDPGEISYFDHYTGFLDYTSNGFINQVILGDYYFEFGQGLVLWSPYSFSKGTEVINSPIKRSRNFTPHTSSEENKFFRGIALSMNMNNFIINTFYSQHNIDATIDENKKISNFFISGYHRTGNEISKKNILREKSYGIHVNYNLNSLFYVGVLNYIAEYNKPFAYKDKYQLYGKRFNFSSLNYNLFLEKTTFYGEIAYSKNTFAIINSIVLNLSKNISLLASYRNYAPSYNNIYANGFGEYSNTKNEIGYYLGTRIKTDFGIINFYYDIFRSPTKSFYSDFPSTGNDFLFHFSSNIFKNILLNFKYKKEEKEVLINSILDNSIVEQIQNNYRIELNYKLTNKLFSKTRFEFVEFLLNNNKEFGYLTYQEIKFNPKKYFSLVGRIILFDTDSYSSRLYEFENDLRGVMTNLPMFGEGFRWYILFNFQPINKIKISLKYSETYKPNIKSISSGNSEIIGNLDNRASIQFDYDF